MNAALALPVRRACLFFCLAAAQHEGDPGTGIQYWVPGRVHALSILASTNGFDNWYRYPSEQRTWLTMTSATAYTRDVLAGGQTFISGAADGDSWYADAQRPDGSTITWGAIHFYSSYGGQQDCFVSPFWSVCGTTSLYVRWYSNAQCQPPGAWTMNFYANGARFYSGQYTLLPQIPPNKVPLFNQGAYTDDYDSICRTGTKRNVYQCDGRPNEVHWTIQAKGCALSSGAMVLGYHGVAVSPPALNTWLIDNQGYDLAGNVYWDAFARYARSVGRTVSFLGTGGNLDTAICTYGPQIIGVHNDGHWVAATGQDKDLATHLINDPDGGGTTTLAAQYGNTYGGIRRYGGPEYTYTDITGIVIRFHSPGELLITNPQGQMTGFDPRTGRSYSQIPGSAYEVISLDDLETGDPGPPTLDLDIRQPVAGEYKLDVIGTASGTYALEINAYDPQLSPSQAVFTDVPIDVGSVDSYAFDYTKTVGGTIQISGGFDGGGQRPRDVNKFLSYVSPGESRTSLPAGTTSFVVVISYGPTILPSTFSAVLNGSDVTSLFNPTPGGLEKVTIPLQSGSNVLKLSVDGTLPTRTATDTDRLVFLVP